MQDFLDVLHSRKSIRSFQPVPVPKEVVAKILNEAVCAPTNCNQQLWNFIVIEDASTKERLIKEAACNTLIRRAPVLIVVSYDNWNYKEAIQGGALAVGYMLATATYYGVGSLPMNSYGSDKKVKKILNIPDNQAICCFILLGYPDEKADTAEPVFRREAREITHWGKFIKRETPSFSYNPEDWTRETLIAHQKFYCRKTFLGKEMDIMSDYERGLVHRELSQLSGPVKDFMTYDGAYIREFPENVNLTTVDLCRETAEYTTTAADLANRKINPKILDTELSPTISTFIYKLERLPKILREQIYKNIEGKFIIIARKKNFFLFLFFFTIKLIFGPDIRKTGIYNFFGPYKPISHGETLRELRQAGFKNISWRGYFLVPTFYEQIWQMFRQYIASNGSSYLHRERREDIISRLLTWLMKLQGFTRFGRFGSVIVIRCKK